MKLASLKAEQRDGRLTVVSRDLKRAVDASAICPTLLAALDNWDEVVVALEDLSRRVDEGLCRDSFPFDPNEALSALPRPRQWLDASAFGSHGRLMARAFGTPERPSDPVPLMYQGMSDYTFGPTEDVPFSSEADEIDFEGEFGVIVGETPMGIRAEEAEHVIRLAVVANDWSLRALGPREMKSGFGFIHAKPPMTFGPVAVTLDELGPAWHDCRIGLPLTVKVNAGWLGSPDGGEMSFSFAELIAHAAYSRCLSAGTVIGSGTVSNTDYERKGFSCLAERRMAEIIESGQAATQFMRYGERVHIEAFGPNGRSMFGAINQRVVPYSRRNVA